MKSRGKKFQGVEANLKLSVVFFLCLCLFFAGLFGSIIISKGVNRGVSRHKLLEETDHEGGDSVAHGESGESSISSIPFQVLSWRPRAVYFPNFATAEQCQTIIDMAKGKLKPSTLALRKGETTQSTKGVRTSSGTFLYGFEDRTRVLEFVERKIARATMLPRSHGEAFNVLRYDIGQRYACHYDSFDPTEYGPMKSQRIASFLLYLSDVEEGGETMFPFENGLNMNAGYDFESCIGLKVKPRRGDGLLFYSLFPNGTIDKTSLHGSCPVVKGEKWVATKWIRDSIR